MYLAFSSVPACNPISFVTLIYLPHLLVYSWFVKIAVLDRASTPYSSTILIRALNYTVRVQFTYSRLRSDWRSSYIRRDTNTQKNKFRFLAEYPVRSFLPPLSGDAYTRCFAQINAHFRQLFLLFVLFVCLVSVRLCGQARRLQHVRHPKSETVSMAT